MDRRADRTLRPVVARVEGRELPSSSLIVALAAGPVHAAKAGGDGNTLTADEAPPASRREVARRVFSARFAGPVAAGPPRTVDQAKGYRIAGPGTSNRFLHGTLQMVYFTPSDPVNGQVIGAANLQDRNNNNGAAVLLDVQGNPEDVDWVGRPTHLTWVVSLNSSGIFVNAVGSGTIDIRYRGGLAVAIFKGSINTSGVSNPLP